MLKTFAIAATALASHSAPRPRTSARADKDIVDTAVAAGSFKTLAAALQAAGLVDTLKGAGPFTVFAPTDEAFAKLPAGTVEDLLKPENKAKLPRILTYHVVPGKVMAADVVKMKSAKTVSGDIDRDRHQGRRRHGRQRAAWPRPTSRRATASSTSSTPSSCRRAK